MLINYNLIGNVLAQNNLCSRELDIASGNIAAEQSFRGWNLFQCHYLRSQQSIFLLGIIRLDPTHMSEIIK